MCECEYLVWWLYFVVGEVWYYFDFECVCCVEWYVDLCLCDDVVVDVVVCIVEYVVEVVVWLDYDFCWWCYWVDVEGFFDVEVDVVDCVVEVVVCVWIVV